MSYKEEVKAIQEWYSPKTDQDFELASKAAAVIEEKGLFDSPLNLILKSHTREYNRRLLEVKEKYDQISAEEREHLAEYRASKSAHEEMLSLCEWLRGEILDWLDAVEKGDAPRGVRPPVYAEFYQRWDAWDKKYRK